MPFMSWDESFSVNVQEIDEQHRKLFGMINEFYQRMRTDSKQAMRELLQSLLDYTIYHFSTEERYFRQLFYPDQQAHMAAHTAFTDKIKDIRSRLEKGELVVTLEVTNFLRDWLIHHVKESDKAYSEHFNKSGIV